MRFLTIILSMLFMTCLPGGVIGKGGRAGQPLVIPTASLLGESSYRILCWDPIEEHRRKELLEREPTEKGRAEARQSFNGPPVREVKPADYRGGCEREGSSSTFFLFGMFPVTAPLNPDYAIGTAVQQLEGDTMINIAAWHEEHLYSLMGRVSVLNIRGTVIRFVAAEKPTRKPARGKQRTAR